ncbi:uncharacterized protein LOC108669904 [Hyalella azteca]|uniref:Uncharacterized protein LOC108669904 n=1 Tax=Hyalella azteca TaxID=294128 RepID=A0A8B7NHG7_HYAAZ|nr:uncharacterized protein LOC108669904 [Hyalella azteca]
MNKFTQPRLPAYLDLDSIKEEEFPYKKTKTETNYRDEELGNAHYHRNVDKNRLSLPSNGRNAESASSAGIANDDPDDFVPSMSSEVDNSKAEGVIEFGDVDRGPKCELDDECDAFVQTFNSSAFNSVKNDSSDSKVPIGASIFGYSRAVAPTSHKDGKVEILQGNNVVVRKNIFKQSSSYHINPELPPKPKNLRPRSLACQTELHPLHPINYYDKKKMSSNNIIYGGSHIILGRHFSLPSEYLPEYGYSVTNHSKPSTGIYIEDRALLLASDHKELCEAVSSSEGIHQETRMSTDAKTKVHESQSLPASYLKSSFSQHSSHPPPKALHSSGEKFDVDESKVISISKLKTTPKGSKLQTYSRAGQEAGGGRGVRGLRHCDSLEGLCDGPDSRGYEHGNGLASQPAAVNATSLPHLNQLTDPPDATHFPQNLPRQPLYVNPGLTASCHASGADAQPTPSPCHRSATADAGARRDHSSDVATPAGDDAPTDDTPAKFGKSNRSKLKRRPPYHKHNKDAPSSGRSKSLTHIDTLGGEGGSPNSAMLGGSDDGGGDAGESAWSGGDGQHQLGVPHENLHQRKKLSLHSKISSSEYIHIVSESLGGAEPVDELIPASHGVTLREALERLGYDMSGASFVIEDTTTSVHPSTETSVLGGRTLRYRGRDASRSPVRTRSAGPSPGQLSSRKQSNTRTAQGWFHRSAASTEDNSPLVDERGNGGPASQDGPTKTSAKVSKRNNRLSTMFSPKEDPRTDALVQKLDLYSKQGIPRQPHLLPYHSADTPDEDFVLEVGGWRELVAGWGELGERLSQQQSAIWELVETEATYCHMIRVITNLFLSCLCNLQNEQLLNDINTELLFSNIPDIYHTNLTFWKDHISRMVAEARRSKQPLDPTLLYDAFTNFKEIFKPYSLYCQQQTQCQQYCKERSHDNEHFKVYLLWCETQKECNRLRLVDILVQPMQRLTKYSLLLKAILKKTDIKEHKWKLNEMITNVECFVSNVNSALRHRHEQERLRDTIGRIEAYDAVEAREEEIATKVKQHSELHLSQPMPGCPEHLSRHLLHQGDYKLRDHNTSKTDVHVFIFTDLLLVTKVTQRKAEKVKVIRPPYNIERLVEVVIGGRDSTTLGLVVLSEWGVAAAAFSLQSPDTAAHRALQEAIKKAKKHYLDAQSGGRDMLEEITSGLRSPRLASSRASRGSSLAPSQSGSVDLTEGFAHSTSPAMLEVSELRASSASSEDSVEGPRMGHHSVDVPSRPGTMGHHLNVTSSQASGQSLPNLSVVSGNSLLKVPSHKNHAPWNRGVSYPPPSPRALRRSPPVPQSRNPPLLKTRHVVSTTGGTTAATGVFHPSSAAVEARLPDQVEEEDGCRSPRRVCRSDRADNRRYHTAGAIDDIKKQDTKDSSIHKRLSWNCGQQHQVSAPGGLCASCSTQTFVTPSNSTCSSTSSRLTSSPSNSSRIVGQCDNRRHKLSCECVHSSSGVSSTSSLHRSITSEVDILENIDNAEDCDRTIVDLGIGECHSGGEGALSPLPDFSSRFSPHISSTYICQDLAGALCGSAQYITQVQPDTIEGEEGALSPAMVTIDVSNTCSRTPSGVQITVTEGPNLPVEESPHPVIMEDDFGNGIKTSCPILKTDVNTASLGREKVVRGRVPLPALTCRPASSVTPPEVPPRTSSPKLPVKRTTSNPQATSASPANGCGLSTATSKPSTDLIRKSNETCQEESSANSLVTSEDVKALRSDTFGSCISDSCSSSKVVDNDDSNSLFRSVPRLPSISETRNGCLGTPSSCADESYSDSIEITTTVKSSGSSTLPPCSSISPSLNTDSSSSASASSSSKCASNSYSSLSSVSSASSSSKQSLSRENSSVRELLLTDSAVETSDV